MEKEENVCEETTLTEAVAIADGAVAQKREDASTVLGKFKDVNALARAYEALQAEFTRRSQRLKELERLTDNLQGDGAAAGAEKLRKHAKARKEAAKAFDEFVSLVGKAHTDDVALSGEPEGVENEIEDVKNSVSAGDDAAFQTQSDSLEEKNEGGRYALKEENTLAAGLDGEGNATEPKGKTARGATAFFEEENLNAGAEDSEGKEGFSAVAKYGNTEISSEELYRRVSRDEGVRLQIIGEYLASIGKSAAPVTANGVGMPIAPPLKAKNIGDAGVMALQFFKMP